MYEEGGREEEMMGRREEMRGDPGNISNKVK